MVDILKLAGFNPAIPTRLVRHQDHRYPVQELLRQDGWLELYQSYQSKPRFHGAKQIVSFYAMARRRAGFYGVYKVMGYRSSSEGDVLAECGWSRQWRKTSRFFYKLEGDKRFEHFRHRLIIDWGPATRTWVQALEDKPVIEIHESGRKLPPFVDYLEFSLTYDQLKDLFKNEDAHPDWRNPLSAVAGIYLILAQKSGHLYVGSACGVSGIWGRWRNYAKSGHGGDAQLRELIERDSDYPRQFRFSVLQTLPKTMVSDQVSEREKLYKQKLGSRATGLNRN